MSEYLNPKPEQPSEGEGPFEIDAGAIDPNAFNLLAKPDKASPIPGALPMGHGHLLLDQLSAIFESLPVDLTFVDADDRVRFFSEGPRRVFKRPAAVIGRLVQHCHPSDSVHLVQQILDDFRSGRESLAEFWLNFKGRFVHIRYYPLRTVEGQYMGTLEVTQDITHERSLEGERRLVQYAPTEAPEPGASGAPASERVQERDHV